jgi:hypothetical protein
MTKKEFLKRIDRAINVLDKRLEERSCYALDIAFRGFIMLFDYSNTRHTYNELFTNFSSPVWLDDYIHREQSKWTPKEVRIFFITMFAEWCLVHKEYKMF